VAFIKQAGPIAALPQLSYLPPLDMNLSRLFGIGTAEGQRHRILQWSARPRFTGSFKRAKGLGIRARVPDNAGVGFSLLEENRGREADLNEAEAADATRGRCSGDF
jgi:hypothetical protein